MLDVNEQEDWGVGCHVVTLEEQDKGSERRGEEEKDILSFKSNSRS